MSATVVGGSAVGRICCIDCERVLLNLATALVVQMTIVKIVHMPFMFDAGVATTRAMLVRMLFRMICHTFLLAG